uniref:COMM domain containing 7 n=1 Tax=Neolamprologus brichardi TaxID=32507 RepID=A0A3Q4H5I3_NEOBR
MQLHFTKDVLPDSVGTDFQNLNKLNEQVSLALTEQVYRKLSEPRERFMQQLTEFAGEHGMSAGPLRNLMKSVLLVPQGALKKNLTGEQIKDDLLTLGLSEEKSAHFSLQVSEVHYAALTRLAVGQTLMVNQLVDMEWKFGGKNDQTWRARQIWLTLELVVRKGNSTENVYMELTLPQFYNFLHEMERAKASMECFS